MTYKTSNKKKKDSSIETQVKDLNRHFIKKGYLIANEHMKYFWSPLVIKEMQIKI